MVGFSRRTLDRIHCKKQDPLSAQDLPIFMIETVIEGNFFSKLFLNFVKYECLSIIGIGNFSALKFELERVSIILIPL